MQVTQWSLDHDSRPRAFASGSIAYTFCGRLGARPMHLHMPAGRTRGIPRVLRLNKRAPAALSHARNFDTSTPHGTTCADSAT